MTRIVFQMIATIVAVPVCVEYLEGVHALDMSNALIAGAVLAVIFLVLRPVVRLVTKVFNFLTLGLLSVFIDAWLVQLCVLLTNGGLRVDSFWWAALMALCINVLRFVVGIFFGKK